MRLYDNFPNLARPAKFLVRLILAVLRLLIVTPLKVVFFMGCIMGGLFARKDINSYKVNSLFSLVLNLIAKFA